MHYYHALLLLLFTAPLGAQTTQPVPTGEYYLQGVMEVGSGFRLNADHTFDFFFTYGALDRAATGTWEQKGDSVILNSPPKPEHDFVLREAKRTDDSLLTIQVSDPNVMMLGYIHCQVKTGDGQVLQGASDNSGRVTFDRAPVDSIALIHEFFPDRFSVFPVENADDNHYVFTIEPTIVEVAITDLVLRLEGDGLVGGHPLIKKEELRYVKGN